MRRIALSLDKTTDQNASQYFERAKRIRKKIDGAISAVEDTKRKLLKVDVPERVDKPQAHRKRQWFEKFRWFFSSEGFLVIGGRDATSNEVLIKKHTDEDDLVFHTDMAGSPFFVVKCQGRIPGEATIEEAADATASYSRAWKAGFGEASVFYVKPGQVSKKAQTGEYLARGAFMIYGKTAYVKNRIGLAIGIKDGGIIAGPVRSISSSAERFLKVSQGDMLPSEAAKRIKKAFGGDIDEIIRFLPPGNISLERGGASDETALFKEKKGQQKGR